MVYQSDEWWIDSGANVNVCANCSVFVSYQESDGRVTKGDVFVAQVCGQGRVDLKLTSGKATTTMGGGNGQKAKMARERNLEKQKGAKGSQLEANKKAMNIQCKVCMQTFICTTSEVKCREHAEAKHPKSDVVACFPHLKK
ncbi:hypothetical protein LWI28_013225 [Acer negundo]|uniref:Uncharacterized protein n=1 Tax=Acer negundo TaxID=4023 RepID=A0AAD5P585_ACENE|nr:hypothetical protein LWI28_013225 [Acer negundo]